MARFKPVEFDDSWCEQDVREDIITPLLYRLGYEKGTENEIYRGERLELKYYKEMLGRPKKTDKPLSGLPDYVLEVDGNKRWVIEAKPPSELITEVSAWQAYSYAKHHSVRAVCFCLCNGRELHIFRTDYLPEAALVKLIKYEDFEKDFDLISNILSPDAIRKAWPEVFIDTGKPLGSGLRSIAHITGGSFKYTSVSIGHPLLQDLLFTITGGFIERSASGKILALITTRSPLASAQEVAEQVGLDRMLLWSQDEVISTDPHNQMSFSSHSDFSIPAGSRILNVTYPQTVSGKSETNVRGYLDGTVFRGTFDALMEYTSAQAALKGNFEAHIIS